MASSNKITDKPKARIHGQLARTEKQRAQNVARLDQLTAAADARHKELQEQLPELRQRADIAVGEERNSAHREYLRAVQDVRHCAQVHASAKRELIRARNF